VYVTGQTGSLDFPVVNGFQTSFGGGFSDAFVVKLNTSGTIVYSSYLGGSGGDEFARAIAVDSAGNAYIAGKTNSTDFPIENAAQAVLRRGILGCLGCEDQHQRRRCSITRLFDLSRRKRF
jgi:beta-propeller repeat-containing protein